jgi:hypothetical protein
MAFPSTFNINYYEGDTYEFKIYPKNSVGGVFTLTPPPGQDQFWTPAFTIATSRGAGATQIICDAAIGSDSTISCEIKPAKGRQLVAGTSYVYDVQISNSSTGKVFTLLTGTVSVTADVSGAS